MIWILFIVVAFGIGYFTGNDSAALKYEGEIATLKKDRDFWFDVAKRQASLLKPPKPTTQSELEYKFNIKGEVNENGKST